MWQGLRSDATLPEATDALLFLADPLLGAPFQAWLSRQADTPLAESLRALPRLAAEARREAHRAALLWASSGAGSHAEAHVARCERRALECFHLLAERQACLSAWLARSAPTDEVRRGFERASQTFSRVADEFGLALRQLREEGADGEPAWRAPPLSCAQEEGRDLDLRMQVMQVVEGLRGMGKRPVRVVLSPTASRHLRDQGCLAEPTLFGVPVAVDFGWPTSSFAVETDELEPLRSPPEEGVAEEGSTG